MKKKLSLLLSVLVVTGVLSGCSQSKNTSASGGDTIKVGLNYELTGQVATYGQSLVEGVELGIEEINKAGGVLGKQIEPIKIDNKSDTTEVANVATRLATREKVAVMLGPATSGNTKAASPIAIQNKIPLVSASATADDVTVDSNGKVRDYIFKTCFSDSYQGVEMANFAYKDLSRKNAAILADSTSDYAQGLAKAFKETFTGHGGKVLTEEAYQAKETDFKAVLTRIKGSNPDVVFIPGYYEEVGLIIKQARGLGIDAPILGGDGYESPKLLELAGADALNDVYFSNHYSSKDTSEEVVKFQKAFKAKYSQETDAFNALGYDLAYLVADAIERAGEADPEKIKEVLASTKDFRGVTGVISIDKNHNPVKSITVLEMINGEQTFLKKLDPQ